MQISIYIFRLLIPISVVFFGYIPQALASGSGKTLYVDCSTTGAGQDGSQGSPFKTIQQSIDAASPGDTVMIHAGVYRESLVFKVSGTADAPITFMASPLGSVSVDGSDLVPSFDSNSTDTDSLSIWSCPSYKPLYGKLDNATVDRWTKQGQLGIDQIERCTREDTLFLDGKRLVEAASKDQLLPETCWVDRQNGGLYVALAKGEQITDHVVEGSVRLSLLKSEGDCSYIHIQGLEFRKAASARQSDAVEIGNRITDPQGLVEGTGRGWVFEDNRVDWNGWCGLAIHGNDHQILRNIFEYNGNEGVGGAHCTNMILDGNISRLNNWKDIRTGFEGGGGKFVYSNNVTVRNHEACYNFGPGIWFDTENQNVHIQHCLLHDNRGGGIFIEISQGPVDISDNICFTNQESGIGVAESSNVTVSNNILAFNKSGIELRNLSGRKGPSDPLTHEKKTYALNDLSIHDNYFLQNTEAGIVNTGGTLDTQKDNIASDNNHYSKNPPVWWKAPSKDALKLSDDGAFTVPETDGFWVLDTTDLAFKKLGLEEHSQLAGLDFPSASVYEFPWPDQIKPGN